MPRCASRSRNAEDLAGTFWPARSNSSSMKFSPLLWPFRQAYEVSAGYSNRYVSRSDGNGSSQRKNVGSLFRSSISPTYTRALPASCEAIRALLARYMTSNSPTISCSVPPRPASTRTLLKIRAMTAFSERSCFCCSAKYPRSRPITSR